MGSGFTPPFRALHANASFERGFTYWGRLNAITTDESSGSEDGNGHVRMRPTVDGGHIFQTMNLARDGQNALRYLARVNYRKASTSDTGTLRIQVFQALVTYGTDHENPFDCQWASGKNQNVKQVGPFYPSGESVFTPDTEWRYGDAIFSGCNCNYRDIHLSYQAVDVRVRVASAVKNTSGQFAFVHIDNTRARDGT